MSDAGLAPRRAALEILSRTRAGQPFDLARDGAVSDLAERDRRLAHELAAGVLRSRSALDTMIAPHAARGLASIASGTLDLLRLGAYQLTALDRVPRHAAVSTTVSLAHEVSGSRTAGFVNAVLRKIAAADRPAAIPAGGSLAERYSHPEWLVERWVARFGAADTEALLQWNNTRPPLVVQPARSGLDRLRRRWAAEGIATRDAPFGAGLIVDGPPPAQLPGYAEGEFIVQDPAQALVSRFADVPEGARVYDACAAPGGKAVALGRRAGLVVAGEARPARAPRLAQNLRRAGAGREFPVLADAAHPPLRAVDAVLLDAPCLGTGTFARHPDARWKVTPEAVARLAASQRDLLEGVAPVVRPGGLLIYSTCSLEPEENELQIDRFLAEHPEFHREPGPSANPALVSPRGDLTLLPQRHGTDGAFAARLRRVG